MNAANTAYIQQAASVVLFFPAKRRKPE